MSRGGRQVLSNLALACVSCNQAKADAVAAVDPLTGTEVGLFNPRRQHWEEHFQLGEDGIRLEGMTPAGRATAVALGFNGPRQLQARALWCEMGWY